MQHSKSKSNSNADGRNKSAARRSFARTLTDSLKSVFKHEPDSSKRSHAAIPSNRPSNSYGNRNPNLHQENGSSVKSPAHVILQNSGTARAVEKVGATRRVRSQEPVIEHFCTRQIQDMTAQQVKMVREFLECKEENCKMKEELYHPKKLCNGISGCRACTVDRAPSLSQRARQHKFLVKLERDLSSVGRRVT